MKFLKWLEHPIHAVITIYVALFIAVHAMAWWLL
ncbi:hypothetical protein [Vibrio phage P23]|nr:hypothetical protein [Vibrio phage P23]